MKPQSILAIIFLLFLLHGELFPSDYKDHEKKAISFYENQTITTDNLLMNSLPPLVPNGGCSKVKCPNKAIFLNFTPAYSRIYNSDVYKDDYWEAKGGFGYSAEVGYIFKIKPIVSIGIGLGLSSFETTLRVDNYNELIPQYIDFETDTLVDYSLTMFDIFEETTVKYFDLPLFIEIGNPNIKKIGYYVKVGVKFSMPISDSYSSNGYLSSNGYYIDYNCYVEGIDEPLLGLYDSYTIDKPWENNLKSFNVSAIAAAGITIPLSNSFIVKFGGSINIGLTEISAKKENDYEDAKYNGDYNSLLINPNSKTSVQSYGVEFGLIYVLSLK